MGSFRKRKIVSAVTISNAETREREKLKQLFGFAYERILSHDSKRGRVSLSTKKLEPTPGDRIRNPKLVFEKAEEMAQTFRQRIAQAKAMARADVLRFQPQSGLTLCQGGILGTLTSDLRAEEI